MNAMQQAAQERLDAVLAAPARGRTRHDQVAELCQQHAKDQHVVTKEVAVAETTATGPDITGEFTAIVSDFGPDRQHERFTIGSFDKALDKIRRTGKATPVLFGHTQNAIGAVLGMVPPDGWRTDHDGLHAHGWLDVTEPLGMRMYKMLQSGALQWSIGFTTTRRAPRGRDGIVPLEEVGELLEVSVVPVPANERTRTLSAKSDRQPMSVEQLRQLEAEVGLAGALNRLEEHRTRIPSINELHALEDRLHADGVLEAVSRVRSRRGRDLNDAITRMRDATRAEMTTILAGTAHRPRDDLRRRATEATAEYDLERAMTFNPRA